MFLELFLPLPICPRNTFGPSGLEEFFEGLFACEFHPGFELAFGRPNHKKKFRSDEAFIKTYGSRWMELVMYKAIWAKKVDGFFYKHAITPRNPPRSFDKVLASLDPI